VKQAKIRFYIAASMLTATVPAFGRENWPGAHPPSYQQLRPLSPNHTEKELDKNLTRNPRLLKEMLKRREVREQIKGDREMLKTMLQDKDLRGEVLRYPDLADRVKRDPIMRELTVEREPTGESDPKGELNDPQKER
jgi:hypothetical protein